MSAERATAATLLGENTVGPLRALTVRLTAATGIDTRLDARGGLRSSADRDAWRHDLIWSCGLLAMRRLADGGANADIVAAPVFAGRESASYHSVLIARAGDVRDGDELAGHRVAINEFASWSGCHALLEHLRHTGRDARLRAVTRSGSHAASIRAIVGGHADVAAVDDTVWEHLAREAPALTRTLRVVERTSARPAPPFLLGRALAPAVRERLLHALTLVRPGDVPGLERIERRDADAYRALFETAEAQGAIVQRLRRVAT